MLRYKFICFIVDVGVVTGHGLDDRGSIPGRGKTFSLLHSIQPGSGAHPSSYPMGKRGNFPGSTVAGA
jgi:hypothetical protein